MGVGGYKSSTPRRAYQPSGPWVDGNGNPVKSPYSDYSESKKKKTPEPEPPNPDPYNYKFVRAEEIHGFLLVQINYPDCTNFEGNKIMLFEGIKLIDLVNQKFIDPHFFQSKEIASPIARFIPVEEGWQMGLTLIEALIKKKLLEVE